MKRKVLIVIGVAAALTVGWFSLPFLSRADVSSSSHFLVEDSYVGLFSGTSSSTNFQMVSGGTAIIQNDATSSHFGTHTGPVNFADYTPQSYTWRWYGDANDEKPTSSLAAENVAPSNVSSSKPIKLRLGIKETGGMGANNIKFSLQYSLFSDFSSGVSQVAEIGSCTATSTWCYASVAGGGSDNTVASSTVLSTSGPCAAGVGTGCGTHNTSGVSTSTFAQNGSSTTEYEFTLESFAPAVGTTYFFRPVYANTGLPVGLYATSSYPSLVTQGATMSFVVGGMPQGTSTNGVVTTVSSTATSIPFGTLTIGTSTMGAQQLTITSNATNGYEIYAIQDSPLANGGGSTIPGVNGTNASPQPWSTACSATSTACYGYHPGSPVLSGGSTRFAANDTYAALTSTVAEIGFGGSPVTSSSFTMVYRLQAGATQVNGSYQNNIAYIVAPIY